MYGIFESHVTIQILSNVCKKEKKSVNIKLYVFCYYICRCSKMIASF